MLSQKKTHLLICFLINSSLKSYKVIDIYIYVFYCSIESRITDWYVDKYILRTFLSLISHLSEVHQNARAYPDRIE